jgi:hypothetical protein
MTNVATTVHVADRRLNVLFANTMNYWRLLSQKGTGDIRQEYSVTKLLVPKLGCSLTDGRYLSAPNAEPLLQWSTMKRTREIEPILCSGPDGGGRGIDP